MPLKRAIGLTLLLAGFASSFFGLTGLTIAFFFWLIGAAMFSHSFLQ